MQAHNKQDTGPANTRWLSFGGIAGWFFMTASMLLLLYVHNRANGIRESWGSDAVYEMSLKYYVVASASIVFWGLVLKLREKTRRKIVIFALITLWGFYLVELSLGLPSPILNANPVQPRPHDWDQRTPLSVYQDMKSAGVDAAPSVYPSDLIGSPGYESFFPLAGLSRKTVVQCNESGEYSSFQSDRYGFNNPDSLWDKTEIEWLLVGDSFAEGSCVQTGEDIRAHLEEMTGEKVLNLGIGGNGPLLELATIVEYAEAKKPLTVVWIYFEGNDLRNLVSEASIPLLMQYLEPETASQNLVHKQSEIDEKLGEYVAEVAARSEKTLPVREESSVPSMGWLKFQNTRTLLGDDSYIHPLFRNILKEARNRVTEWGGEIYFVYLPEYERYSKALRMHNLYKKRNRLIDLVNSLSIPVIDIHSEVFQNHTDPFAFFPLRRRGHYTSDGYAEVARAVLKNVRDQDQ